jgi:hypothetical protein
LFNDIPNIFVEKSKNIDDFIIKTPEEVTMKKEKEKKELKKKAYKKPVVTKHKKLTDITAGGTYVPPTPVP